MKCRYEVLKDLRDRLGLLETHFVLLSVSRISVEKGMDDVIKALSAMNSKALDKLRYVVLGDGNAMVYLKKLTRNLGLTKNVVFVGGVPHQEIIPYYDMCDLFVLPSRRGPNESFGRVFVEAAARSKPSIASKGGGMVEVIDEGKTGFLITPGDVEAIRNKIIYLMNNLDVLEMLGKNAKIKAKRSYTSRNIAEQFNGHIKRVLENLQMAIP